jgi:hypothetical protein
LDAFGSVHGINRIPRSEGGYELRHLRVAANASAVRLGSRTAAPHQRRVIRPPFGFHAPAAITDGTEEVIAGVRSPQVRREVWNELRTAGKIP